MKYEAYDYQAYATEYVVTHHEAVLMLQMGLGKTVITLTALWDLLYDSFEVGRVLIIAPLFVARDMWPAEIKKWDHLKDIEYSVVLGSAEQRRAALLKKVNLFIINRENVSWLTNYRWDFDMVVVDELSSFKSHQAKRWKDLRRVRPKVKRIVGLTGTPGGLMDLWAEIGIIDMGQRLGRYIGAYREQYFLPDKRSRDMIYSYKPKEGAAEKIFSLISDICISMKACDYIKLPECLFRRVVVHMDTKEMKLYCQMEKDMLLPHIDGDVDAATAGALSNKLMQMAGGAVYDENEKVRHIHDKKLDALESLIEMANGQPVLVAYWYKHDIERIKNRIDVQCLRTSEDFERWNRGEIQVGAIHPASTAYGLNLQKGGHILIWFALTWSLELFLQCIARLHRQGQKHTVMVYLIIADGTIDEDAVVSLETKDCNQSAVIDAVKARIGGVSNASTSRAYD